MFTPSSGDALVNSVIHFTKAVSNECLLLNDAATLYRATSNDINNNNNEHHNHDDDDQHQDRNNVCYAPLRLRQVELDQISTIFLPESQYLQLAVTPHDNSQRQQQQQQIPAVDVVFNNAAALAGEVAHNKAKKTQQQHQRHDDSAVSLEAWCQELSSPSSSSKTCSEKKNQTSFSVLMEGFPGSGKSTLAKTICRRQSFLHINNNNNNKGDRRLALYLPLQHVMNSDVPIVSIKQLVVLALNGYNMDPEFLEQYSLEEHRAWKVRRSAERAQAELSTAAVPTVATDSTRDDSEVLLLADEDEHDDKKKEEEKEKEAEKETDNDNNNNTDDREKMATTEKKEETPAASNLELQGHNIQQEQEHHQQETRESSPQPEQPQQHHRHHAPPHNNSMYSRTMIESIDDDGDENHNDAASVDKHFEPIGPSDMPKVLSRLADRILNAGLPIVWVLDNLDCVDRCCGSAAVATDGESNKNNNKNNPFMKKFLQDFVEPAGRRRSSSSSASAAGIVRPQDSVMCFTRCQRNRSACDFFDSSAPTIEEQVEEAALLTSKAFVIERWSPTDSRAALQRLLYNRMVPADYERNKTPYAMSRATEVARLVQLAGYTGNDSFFGSDCSADFFQPTPFFGAAYFIDMFAVCCQDSAKEFTKNSNKLLSAPSPAGSPQQRHHDGDDDAPSATANTKNKRPLATILDSEKLTEISSPVDLFEHFVNLRLHSSGVVRATSATTTRPQQQQQQETKTTAAASTDAHHHLPMQHQRQNAISGKVRLIIDIAGRIALKLLANHERGLSLGFTLRNKNRNNGKGGGAEAGGGGSTLRRSVSNFLSNLAIGRDDDDDILSKAKGIDLTVWAEKLVDAGLLIPRKATPTAAPKPSSLTAANLAQASAHAAAVMTVDSLFFGDSRGGASPAVNHQQRSSSAARRSRSRSQGRERAAGSPSFYGDGGTTYLFRCRLDMELFAAAYISHHIQYRLPMLAFHSSQRVVWLAVTSHAFHHEKHQLVKKSDMYKQTIQVLSIAAGKFVKDRYLPYRSRVGADVVHLLEEKDESTQNVSNGRDAYYVKQQPSSSPQQKSSPTKHIINQHQDATDVNLVVELTQCVPGECRLVFQQVLKQHGIHWKLPSHMFWMFDACARFGTVSAAEELRRMIHDASNSGSNTNDAKQFGGATTTAAPAAVPQILWRRFIFNALCSPLSDDLMRSMIHIATNYNPLLQALIVFPETTCDVKL